MADSSSSRAARVLAWSPVISIPLLLALGVYLVLQNRALSAEVDLLARDVAAMHAQVVETRDGIKRLNADKAARRAAKLAKQAQANSRRSEKSEEDEAAAAERRERRRARAAAQAEGQPRKNKRGGGARSPDGDGAQAAQRQNRKKKRRKGKGRRKGAPAGAPATDGAQVVEG